jgi:small subunit ribosomal protein S16
VAVTIRLTRMGKKKRPFYRLVLMDHRKRRDGAYLANLGYYNPFVEPFEVRLHEEEILRWLKRGATVSETARSLLRSQGVLHRFALERQGLGAEEIAVQMDAWRAKAEDRQTRHEKQRADRVQAAAEKREQAEAAQAAAAASEAVAEENGAAAAEQSAEVAQEGAAPESES